MFSTLVTVALLATSALGQLVMDTPVFTQCKNVDITWKNGKGPYNLIVVDAATPCGDAVADLGDHDGTNLSWKVALPSGKKYELSLEDADGNEAWSGAITVAKSDDASCVPNNLKAAVASPSSSGSVTAAGGSTLVVTPTVVVPAPSSTASASGSGSSGLSGAVGGVGNAGSNPLGLGSGALSVRQASTPIMVLGAFAAILVASL